MVKDPRKRKREKERKAEKQRRKSVEYARSRKGILDQHRSRSESARLGAFVSKPWHECRVLEELFDAGIGHVFISRRIDDSTVVVGAFLVDTRCLGIKDAFHRITSIHEYKSRIIDGNPAGPLVEVDPAYARKLVESAYAYADSLGLPQSPEYANVHQLFGNVDPTDCKEEFEFGQDGMPFFCPGPYDSPGFCERVIMRLTERLGEDGFNYIEPL